MQRDTASVGQWPGPGIAGCAADLGVSGAHYLLECNLSKLKYQIKINSETNTRVDLSVGNTFIDRYSSIKRQKFRCKFFVGTVQQQNFSNKSFIT